MEAEVGMKAVEVELEAVVVVDENDLTREDGKEKKILVMHLIFRSLLFPLAYFVWRRTSPSKFFLITKASRDSCPSILTRRYLS